MKTRQLIYIDSFEFQLKVSLTNQNLHLLLFQRISQRFYSNQYNNTTSLFHNIAGLFKKLQQISLLQSQMTLSKHFIFEPSKLQLITYVCGGLKTILIDFQLKEFSSSQNYMLLQDRLSRYESDERILARKFERLNGNFQLQKQKETTLLKRLRQVNSSEVNFSNVHSQKQSTLNEMKKNIQRKKRELTNIINLCQQYRFYSQKQQKDRQSNPKILQFLVKNQKVFEAIDQKTLKVQCDLTLSKQKLVSSHYITPHTIFELRTCILNLNFDIVLGISSSSQLDKVGVQSAGCVALSAKTQSLYICGLHFLLECIQKVKPLDQINMTVDRMNNTIEFICNDKRLISFQIPVKMADKNLYLFLSAGPGDQIRIDSCSQIKISSEQ